MNERIRVLHCPTTVGGNPVALARAERALGLDSVCVTLERRYHAYPADETLWDAADDGLARERKRWGLLFRALRDFDIVHFNFGSSILPQRRPSDSAGSEPTTWRSRLFYRPYAALFEMRDLAWLARRGVGIVVTYQGDDARQGDFCREHFEISTASVDDYYTAEGDALKRRRIARVDRHSQRIHSLNPDLLHVLPERATFLPYASVDLDEWRPAAPAEPGKRPVVLHAPTHRGAKGTPLILEAIKRLEREGLDFEFVLVEGMSRDDARRLYERADLLIDQLLAGWYGGVAVELMALGKPVICFLREKDLGFLPPAMRGALPIIPAAPADIYQTLKTHLTERRAKLPEIGRRSRAFVEAWHDPRKIAADLKREYEEIVASLRRA